MTEKNEAGYSVGEWVSHWKTNEVLGKIVSLTEDMVFVDTINWESESFFITEIKHSTTNEVLIERMKRLANPRPGRTYESVKVDVADLNQLIELAAPTKTVLNLFDLQYGCTLQKGKRKRIYLGMSGFMVYYTTPSSKAQSGERIDLFKKWMIGAKLV